MKGGMQQAIANFVIEIDCVGVKAATIKRFW